MNDKFKEQLAKKIVDAGPFQPVKLTLTEMAVLLSGQMTKHLAKAREEKGLDRMAGESSPAPDTMYPPVGHIGDPQYRADQKDLNAKLARHNEEQSVKKAYLVEREITFEEIVTPLIKWMAENSCPHSHVVISGTSAELFHGAKSFNTFEFVKD